MRNDEGRKLTDIELAELEKRIRESYGKAVDDLKEIIDDYFEKFRKRDAEMRKLVGKEVNGRVWTEEDYKQWRLAQMGRGQRFEAMRAKLAERLTHANEVALAYVNDKTPGIYTLNRNYAAYEIEAVGTGVDFTLYDESTVRRLIDERPSLMPYYPAAKALKRGIDLEYGKKQITAAVTSGILMGTSTRKIAADLRKRIVDMSIDSAIRAARTAVTAAENGGRQASYERAAEMGIELTRKWLATHDARTRHAHGAADGQEVGVKEPFIVGGEKLMFPGDSSMGASGWNIYNCRCGLETAPKGKHRTRETYSEWLARKMEEDPDGTTLEFKKAARASADRKQWKEYRAIVGNAVPNSLDRFQELKYTDLEKWDYVKDLKKYLTKYPTSNQKFYDAQQTLKEHGMKNGVLLPATKIRAYILPSGKHDPYHIMKRMMKRGITDDELRGYSDNAKAMIIQWGGERRKYITDEGMCVVEKQQDDWVYKTAWEKEDYDEESDRIMEVLKNVGL